MEAITHGRVVKIVGCDLRGDCVPLPIDKKNLSAIDLMSGEQAIYARYASGGQHAGQRHRFAQLRIEICSQTEALARSDLKWPVRTSAVSTCISKKYKAHTGSELVL